MIGIAAMIALLATAPGGLGSAEPVSNAGPLRRAELALPAELASVAPFDVGGHSPRTWKQPLRFGPYETGAVHDGTTFSWSTELFGVRGGRARRIYRLTLVGPTGEVRQVECRTRSIEAWRKGWTVELTDAFEPRLACGLGDGDAAPARLVLGSNGRRLVGRVEAAGIPAFEIRSLHALAGSRLPLDEPAGYELRIGGEIRAAVEVLNRGRVWLAPDLDPAVRDLAAGAIAALLLYDPEITPQVDDEL